MLQVKPTEHLIGVTIQGDYQDFYALVESIYNITGPEDDPDYYYGVKKRLLGLCYDIRHAYMGDRDIVLEDNGMNKDIMKYHNLITPTQNVYYNVNIFFPEAIFIAAALPQIYYTAASNYGLKAKKLGKDIPPIPYTNYERDKANLNVLCAAIWQALGTAIGDDEVEKLIHKMHRTDEDYMRYAIQYIDRCNIELHKAMVDKRKDKLKSIAKRIINKPQAYYSMVNDLRYWAREYKTNIYELQDPRIEYPEEIEW